MLPMQVCRSWPDALASIIIASRAQSRKRFCVDMQVTLCEQLASYLAKFKPAAQSNAAAASSADVVVPQGMQVLKKKGKPRGHVQDL